MNRVALCLTLGYSLWCPHVFARVVSFTGGVYSENFDSMGLEDPATTPPGWFVGPASNGNGIVWGTSVATRDGASYTARNGNYGSVDSPDRALGSLASSLVGGDLNTEVRVQNDTGAPIFTFKVLYDGEQWRANGVTEIPQSLVLKFSTNGTDFVNLSDSFNFTAPINTGNLALDGNLPENRVPDIGGVYSPGTPILPGELFYLRWWDANNAGSDHVLAIDNFRLSISIAQPVMILSQPEDQMPLQGRPATFQVKASGTNPQFQWFKEGAGPIDGATTDTLTIPAPRYPEDNGHYYAVVSNPAGVVTSRIALLSVVPDKTPPSLIHAVAHLDPRRVTVSFSEPIDPASFNADGTGFRIKPVAGGDSLPMLSATASDGTTLVLTSASRQPMENYLLRIESGVSDLYGNAVAPDSQIAIASEVLLIAMDAIAKWRYDESGRDLGTAWRDPAFLEDAWKEGAAVFDAKQPQPPGRLLVSEEPVRTHLSLTNEFFPVLNIPTFYFRKHFNFPGDPAQSKLLVRPFIDDGAVVYLNGQEAWRLRMPEGPIQFHLYSDEAVEIALFQGPFELPLTNLVAGDNVIAVEVHNATENSSDITFGLELIGVIPTLKPSQSPQLAFERAGDTLVISWTDRAAVLQCSDSAMGPWKEPAGGMFNNLSYRIDLSAFPAKFFLLLVP